MENQKPPMLLLELADKRNSGWVQDGTERSANPMYVDTQEMTWVETEGFMGEIMTDGTPRNKKIRYIPNVDIIDQDRQDELKIDAKRKKSEIVFHRGFMTVVRERGTIGLYDYCANVFYNENAPNRPSTATAIFRVVDLNKKAEEINESDIEVVMALAEVYKLQKKNSKGGYDYNEAKIDSYASVLNIHGGIGYGQKIKAISDFAKVNPTVFMESITAFDSVVSTEVAHAEELGVLEFQENVAQYKEGNEIIKSLGTQKMNKKQKIDSLSEYLKTPDGNEALTKLRAALEVAKEKNLK